MARKKALYLVPDIAEPIVLRRIVWPLSHFDWEIAGYLRFEFKNSIPFKNRIFHSVKFHGLFSRLFLFLSMILKRPRFDLIIARNLDLFLFAKIWLFVWGHNKRVECIYEVLDLHRFISNKRFFAIYRQVEGLLCGARQKFIVSSPGFVPYLRTNPQQEFVLLFNQIACSDSNFCRAKMRVIKKFRAKKFCLLTKRNIVKILFIGKIRCLRSLEILSLVSRRDPNIQVEVHGFFDKSVEDEARLVLERSGRRLRYCGSYRSIDELSKEKVPSFIWAVDFVDPVNSRVLVPNRVFEAGFLGLPVIAAESTVTGVIVKNNGLGLVMSEADLSRLTADFLARFYEVSLINFRYNYGRILRNSVLNRGRSVLDLAL